MALHTAKWASWGISETGLGIQGAVPGNGASGDGVVTDFEVSVEPIMAQEQNELGSVIQNTCYDKRYQATGTLQIKADVALPDATQAITIDTIPYYLTSARITENNTSYRKYACTFERYQLTGQVTIPDGENGIEGEPSKIN